MSADEYLGTVEKRYRMLMNHLAWHISGKSGVPADESDEMLWSAHAKAKAKEQG